MIRLDHLYMDDRIQIKIDGAIIISCTYEVDIVSDGLDVIRIDDVLLHGETMAFPVAKEWADRRYIIKHYANELDAAALANSKELAERERQEHDHETYLESMERRGR